MTTIDTYTASLPRHILLQKARERTQFVRKARVALPVMIVGLFVLAVASVVEGTKAAKIIAKPDATAARMINPQFSGRDADGGVYRVQADAAIRDQSTIGLIHLEAPILTRGEGKDELQVTANGGQYKEQDQTLTLENNVVAETQSGAKFTTDQADMNIGTGYIAGNAAITGTTQMGTVRANAFEIINNGERVIFKGSVKARINTRS